MNPRYVTPPEQLERALRDLITGWQEVVFSEPTATDGYRELTQQAALDVQAALREGGTPYQAAIFALAPLFAAADEETVEVVVRPDDENEDEATTMRRAIQAGTEQFQTRGRGGRANTPVYIEIGTTPDDTPDTPPHLISLLERLERPVGLSFIKL